MAAKGSEWPLGRWLATKHRREITLSSPRSDKPLLLYTVGVKGYLSPSCIRREKWLSRYAFDFLRRNNKNESHRNQNRQVIHEMTKGPMLILAQMPEITCTSTVAIGRKTSLRVVSYISSGLICLQKHIRVGHTPRRRSCGKSDLACYREGMFSP
jgi:hypothetical protein